jgi:type II secretory pathway predicted ATPase ExeA
MTPPPRPSSPPEGGQDLGSLAGQKLGNYRLERLVGRGRMGAVYLAKDEALLRPTAVKILSWRAGNAAGVDPVQWFLAEARLVARINHPRVVQIYGAARQGDLCYLAMEYVAGRSAATVIEQDGRMTPEAATDVLVQAASALAAAHRCGVIHRDVKPANLLLGPSGVAKLGDFGMALGLSELRTGTAHLRVGTPLYTAPEIWQGEIARPASDLYSLGVTYFQLLTGKPPFAGPEVAQVEQAHLRTPAPDPRTLVPDIPAACVALIKKALAKDPKDRQKNAEDLVWEGRRILQDLSAQAHRSAAVEAAEVPAAAPPLPPWAQALGFARAPFGEVDPAAPPYQGEPFGKLAALLAARAEDDGTPVLALTGGPESGRTTLCRGLAADLGGGRLVVVADLAEDPSGRSVIQRVCRAMGGSERPDAGTSLERVVERLAEERRRSGKRPYVVVDGVASPPPLLVRLLQAAGASRAFGVLAVGAPGLGAALVRAGVQLPGGVPELDIPPLGRDQVLAYARSWLAATRAASAPLLLLSPDALLLVAMRSGGALGRINRIAENMLLLAAADGRRTVTSFHAWSASDRERWSVKPPAELPRPPADWPSPGVRGAIDACRRASGTRPYPAARPAAPQPQLDAQPQPQPQPDVQPRSVRGEEP